MIITNSDGNQAVYGNQQLFTQEILQDNIIIFPNPVKDKLYIKNSRNGYFVIKISDAHGQLLSQQKVYLGEVEIDFSTYVKGVYLVIIESENKILKTKKIIKN